MRVREIAEEGDERWAGGTTPWETGGMAGRLRDCLGSEREEATTSVLSPSVISREWASCMTNTAGWRVREGTPPRARRSRSREILSGHGPRHGHPCVGLISGGARAPPLINPPLSFAPPPVALAHAGPRRHKCLPTDRTPRASTASRPCTTYKYKHYHNRLLAFPSSGQRHLPALRLPSAMKQAAAGLRSCRSGARVATTRAAPPSSWA